MQTLEILSGVEIRVGEEQTLLAYGDVTHLQEGEVVRLENPAHELIGVAEVLGTKRTSFALVQRGDLVGNAHPQMTTWADAYEVFLSQVDEFSQIDQVTVLAIKPQAVSSVGIEINAVEEVEDTEPADDEDDYAPTEDEQYAALDEVAND